MEMRNEHRRIRATYRQVQMALLVAALASAQLEHRVATEHSERWHARQSTGALHLTWLTNSRHPWMADDVTGGDRNANSARV